MVTRPEDMMRTLSILIPTITTRRHYLSRLMGQLDPQLTPDVEVVTLIDDGEISIGAKRNDLLRVASGQYVAFIDDDDEIAPTYIAQILDAAKTSPDCITFVMDHYEGDRLLRQQRFNLRDGIKHLCPIRTAIARLHQFPDHNSGEDVEWCKLILPHLQSEVHIRDSLYSYRFRHERPGEMTNQLRQDFGLGVA
jgi:hypothetical protein